MDDHVFNADFCKDDVHGWFGLTYASYFAMPRSVMQSMSAEWQHKFVELMEQCQELYGGYDMDYTVHLKNARGRYAKDPLRDYERGRRYVAPKPYDWKIQAEGEVLSETAGEQNGFSKLAHPTDTAGEDRS